MMNYILYMEHEWNKNKHGYLGNASPIGYYVTDTVHFASFFSTLDEAKDFIKESTNEGLMDIEGVN